MLRNDMILFYDFVDIHYHICLDDNRRILKILPSFYCRLVQAAFFCPCFQSDPGGCSRDKGVDGCRNIRKEGAAGLAAATQPATACQRYKFICWKICLSAGMADGREEEPELPFRLFCFVRVSATRFRCRRLHCCGCCRQCRSSNSWIWSRCSSHLW